MNRTMILAIFLALPLPALAQDHPCCGKGGAQPWDGYNKGIQWTQPVDTALKKAAEEKKPVLLFRMVGDLNKEGC